jgi:hypothetical protein
VGPEYGVVLVRFYVGTEDGVRRVLRSAAELGRHYICHLIRPKPVGVSVRSNRFRYFDAALGEEFFDVAVKQSISEVPADGEHDDLGRGPETIERGALNRGRRCAAVLHSDTIARRRADPSTQQAPQACSRGPGAGRPVMNWKSVWSSAHEVSMSVGRRSWS